MTVLGSARPLGAKIANFFRLRSLGTGLDRRSLDAANDMLRAGQPAPGHTFRPWGLYLR